YIPQRRGDNRGSYLWGYGEGGRVGTFQRESGGIEILASRVIRDFPGQLTHSDASLREIPDSQRLS
ncbi:MAG: hypothetical protein WCD63_00515, partial [Terrimicrobiaceae bacterium]